MSSTPVGGRSDRPSPATLAAATAQQAADVMPRETALQDGVLLVLSYEGDNIFVLSNSSYEHVLDSALAHFTLRNVDRTRIRLALQTTIGTSETLVYITPDTWPAVASRAKVITVLVQPPPSTPSQSSPNPPAKPTPSATHRVASPVRESEPTSWPGSPRPSTSWHPAYPASVAYPLPAPPASSPTRGTAPRSLAHSRQHSQSAATASASAPHYPYAHMHYFPAPPSAVSPTTDLSFIGVRPLTEAELKQERPSHAVPAKRHWEQAEHAASDERASYPRPPPETSGGSESARSRELAGSSQPDESRKPKRVSLNALRVQTSRLTPTPGAGMEPARPPVLVQALPANRLAGLEKGAFADLHSSASHVAIRHAYSAADVW
ncbi:hypothetical protein FRC10_005322 [Ceratobasidium sp. 414]|nr:hypothetical protein FRC10_005322 [Ceratobasidium sp. 414]